MNNNFFEEGIVKYIIENNGQIIPLLLNEEITGGTGLMNPSVYVDNDTILINLRHTNYTLYHSESKVFAHAWGPLQYLHPENDQTLRTKNFLMTLDKNLNVIRTLPIDTVLDQPPQWHFIGLEDARLFKWNDKFYICGVRRDDNKTGSGRMQLQELEITEHYVKEVNRHKIPAPGNNASYCEKNWMPIIDRPYHFVKWTNPTELVYADIINNTSSTVLLDESKKLPLPNDLRGSSQVIPWNDGHLAITHEVNLYNDIQGRKDGKYRHRFVYWDKNWNLTKTSDFFHFMTGEIEFCAGLAKYKDDLLITFGFQDNAAYLLKMPIKLLDTFIKLD